MNIRNILIPFLLIPLFLSVSCVSVNIGSEKSQRAKDVQYKPPQKPYTEMKNELVDNSWKNPVNGNSISYFSECSVANEIALDALKMRPLSGIDNLQIKKETQLTFNGRKSVRTVYTGDVDGVESQFEILVFKKNSCSYILTYVALPKTFAEDLPTFEKFLSTFGAP